MYVKWKQVFFITIFSYLLSACSLEASLTSLEEIANPVIDKLATEADFISGEVVTTGSGVVIKGTFGELSEKQVLSNGIQIEGAFYE